MKVVTTEQMKQIDKTAIELRKIPSLQLMESAGKAVVEAVLVQFPHVQKIAIFVGKGNNGGDGLVVARLLHQQKKKVMVYLTAKSDEMSPDAKSNLKKYLKLNNISKPIELVNEDDLKLLKIELIETDIIVDALLGTGTKGVITGLLSDLIPLLNESGKPIVAIDLPSGLDADTGDILGVSIRAAVTITLGLPKPGLVTYPGAESVGKLMVADIGLPKDLVADELYQLNWITASEMNAVLPPRKPDTHKNDYGHVFVLSGSVGFTGAATLVSLGAIRAGAGLVTLGIPRSLNDIMEEKLTEVMTLPLPETDKRSLSLDAEQHILKFVQKATVVALGPGLSLHDEAVELIFNLLPKINLPMVIDADGITAIAKNPAVLKQLKSPVILTPHPGEMARLIRSSNKSVQADRIGTARRFAEEYHVILVLKGTRTVIAQPNGQVYINSTGNPGMASGGVGDVLTGLIAGFLAQKMTPINSALLGVYLHGLAADLAAEQLTQYCLIASDILTYLPLAIKKTNQMK